MANPRWIDPWKSAAVEWKERALAAEAALARVEAECAQWSRFRDPNVDRVVDGIRAALRGPQDEEAAQVCGAHGCSNRATGMRKSHVPGWADVPDCGLHTQRSAGSGRAAERVEGAIKLGANPAVRETQNAAETPADHALRAKCVRGCEKPAGHTGACMRSNPR